MTAGLSITASSHTEPAFMTLQQQFTASEFVSDVCRSADHVLARHPFINFTVEQKVAMVRCLDFLAKRSITASLMSPVR